jgi:protein import protein ZIM17
MLRLLRAAAGRRSSSFRYLTAAASTLPPLPSAPSIGAAPAAAAPSLPGVRAEEDAYALLFTCRVCETRTARRVSKAAYHTGTVLIRCPGCRNMHLIADHKGFFHDDAFDVASVLAARGEAGARGGDEHVLELREEDLAALRAPGGSVRLKSTSHGAAGEEPAVLTFENAVSEAAEKVVVGAPPPAAPAPPRG